MKTRIKKIRFFILLFVVMLINFDQFMTYDRKYNISKEFIEEVTIATATSKFNFDEEVEINVQNIKLPTERLLKIKFQKWLSKINLMNYGAENGILVTLKTNDTKEILRYKGWCLGDHLIGLEIKYKNLNEKDIEELKRKTTQIFSNYKIIWTKL